MRDTANVGINSGKSVQNQNIKSGASPRKERSGSILRLRCGIDSRI